MIGKRLGNFEITDLIGEGGMGQVWGARHVRLGHGVAIKVLRPEVGHQRGVVERFFVEAKAAAELQHPGIIQVQDFDEIDGIAYIVMEKLIGVSLRDRLTRDRRLSLARTIDIVDQLAAVLDLAHAKGIVHRDLKPDNVFLAKESPSSTTERVKILDFGIAKLMNVSGITGTGAMLGTPRYLSPEQCSDAGAVDHRTDLYALGCMIFEMLTGRPPFLQDTLPELVGAHLYAVPVAPSTLGADPGVDHTVLRALAKRPEDRFNSAGELARSLRGDSAGLTPAPITPYVIAAVAPTVAIASPVPANAPTAVSSTDQRAAGPTITAQPIAPPSRKPFPKAAWGGIAGGLIAGGVVTFVLARSPGNKNTLEDPRVSKMWQPTLEQCTQGDAAACTRLARAYNGIQLADDPAKRLEFATKACNGGDGEGCVIRGIAFKNGVGVGPNAATALESFEQGCTLKFGGGCNIVGMSYVAGESGTKDVAKALAWFERGCTYNHAASCGNVGSILVERGEVEAGKAQLQKGCDADAAAACMELGRVLEASDPSRAAALRKRACRFDSKFCP